jgi:uncharacterized membrane protein
MGQDEGPAVGIGQARTPAPMADRRAAGCRSAMRSPLSHSSAHVLEAKMSQLETLSSITDLADPRTASLTPRLALAAATVGAGLSAGLFYAYQVSVTRGLAEVDEGTYVATFRAINDRIQNPWFFAVFLGTAPLTAAALALNRGAGGPVRALVGAGLVLNVALVAITAFGNIPLNEDLAGAEVSTPAAAAAARAGFEMPWNRLNLARTLVAVAGFVALTIANVVQSARHRP